MAEENETSQQPREQQNDSVGNSNTNNSNNKNLRLFGTMRQFSDPSQDTGEDFGDGGSANNNNKKMSFGRSFGANANNNNSRDRAASKGSSVASSGSGGGQKNDNENSGGGGADQNGSASPAPVPPPVEETTDKNKEPPEQGENIAGWGKKNNDYAGWGKKNNNAGWGENEKEAPPPKPSSGFGTSRFGSGGSSFGGRGRGGPNAPPTVNRFGTGNAAATGANSASLGSGRGGGRGAGGGPSFSGGRGGARGGGANRFGSSNASAGRNGEYRFDGSRAGGGGDNSNFGGERGGGRGGRGGSGDRGGRGGGGARRFGGDGNEDQGGGNRFPFSYREECQGPRIFETEEERARAQSHIPVFRTVDEVFAEDVKVSYQYKGIREEDEEVEVTGLAEEAHQQILDDWKDAAFEPKLQENIERATYLRPRKIQSLTIPLIMDGHDIKGHAETGSGKSAAFLLPIINQIVKKKNGEYTSKRICPYALIIEPTRELAIQLFEQACKLAKDTGTTVSVAYGKFKRRENIRDISVRGCDILIGTPGRLVDFFCDKLLEFDNMKILVLDEADELLEDSFARELRQLTKLPGWPKNEQRQTLLFSATFPLEVQQWADEWMRKEKSVFVSNRKLVDANTRVIQQFMNVTRGDKNNMLLKLLKDEEEEGNKDNPENPVVKRTMVFVKMKRAADVVSTFLNVHQLKSTTINGDRPQKLREEALNEFRQGKHNIVITTDVCARGIDIKDLDHVINLDLPTEYVTYVHRIGRTGRLKEGTATSFFDPLEDMELAMELVKGCQTANQQPPQWLVEASEGKSPPINEQSLATAGWESGPAFSFRKTAAPTAAAPPDPDASGNGNEEVNKNKEGMEETTENEEDNNNPKNATASDGIAEMAGEAPAAAKAAPMKVEPICAADNDEW